MLQSRSVTDFILYHHHATWNDVVEDCTPLHMREEQVLLNKLSVQGFQS